METKTRGLSEKGQFWMTHIQSCRSSGDSVTSYVRKHDLKEGSYYFWKARLQKQGHLNKPSPRKVSFQKVSIQSKSIPVSAEAIKITFPNGIILDWKGQIPENRIVSLLSHWLK